MNSCFRNVTKACGTPGLLNHGGCAQEQAKSVCSIPKTFQTFPFLDHEKQGEINLRGHRHTGTNV